MKIAELTKIIAETDQTIKSLTEAEQESFPSIYERGESIDDPSDHRKTISLENYLSGKRRSLSTNFT